MKKLFALFIFVMSLCLLLSCGEDGGGTQIASSDTVTAETGSSESGERVIVDGSGTKYKIIVADGAAALYSAATDLKGEMFSIASKNVYVRYDSAEVAQACEILVGNTNRAESKATAQGLKPEEYRVMWQGEKLVVAGGTDYAVKAGLLWLYDNHIKGDEGAVSVPLDIDCIGKVDVNLNFEGLESGWSAHVYPAENGIELQYQIYMPKGYDKTKDYPCILYMHSAGVRCDDNSHIHTGEAKFLRNFESGKYKDEAIIIAPCCPKTDKWVPVDTWAGITYDFVNKKPTAHMQAVTELFALARENLSLDSSRLYLYGMSMGGFAVWDLLARNPDMFAAAIPVAGAGDPSVVSKLSGTAFWIFHGTADPTVPFASGESMRNALIAAGRTDIKFTAFEGMGHGIWGATADTDGLYDWLFAQKRK